MAYAWPAAEVGQRYLLTFNGVLNGQRTMSTFWYGVDSLVGTPSIAALSNSIRAKIRTVGGLWTQYRGSYPNNGELSELWIQCMHPIRYVKITYADVEAGLASDPANTANIAACISRRGVVASRKAVSTLHMPIPTTDVWLDEGTLQAGAVASLDALALAMVTPITTAEGHVLTAIINNGPGVLDFSLIGVTQVQQTVRVMRRRTVGLGI